MLTGINTVNSNRENCEYSKKLIEAARELLEDHEAWINSGVWIDSELEEDFFLMGY